MNDIAAESRTQSGGWPAPGVAWFAVVLLMLAYLFSYIDRTVLTLLVQPVKASLHLTDTDIGWLIGPAFGLFFTLTSLPFGWLTDSINRTKLVAAGIAFWSVMTMGCGMSSTFVQLFTARIGVGIGEATLSPSAPSLLADYFPPERRTLPLSMYVIAGGAGTSIALIAGGFVAKLVHGDSVAVPLLGAMEPWQVIFLVVSTPGLLVAVLFMFLREPQRLETGQAAPTTAELKRVLASRGGVLIPQALGICLFQLQAFAFGSWAPAFFMRVHHWSLSDVGIKFGLIQLLMGSPGGIASGIVARKLLERGRRDGNLLTAAIFLGATIIPGLVGLLADNIWVAVIGLGLMAFFAHGPAGAGLASIQEIVPNRLRGRVTAIYYAALGIISMTFGPLIIGPLNDHVFTGEQGIRTSLAVVTAIALPLGTASLLLAARRRRTLNLDN